ncbi:MAG: hypothetical protein D6715_09875 [Calditrichaeota bacterium]|nr:MAG: hypothetical protein D6715_09875 [Calditrichota bacterium]
MSIRNALGKGIGKVNRAIWFVALLYLANVGFAFILGGILADQLAESLGSSASAQKMLDGYDDYWYANFNTHAQGLATTFHPGVVGIGAVLNAVDATVTGRLFQSHPAVLGGGILLMVLWAFATGGLLALFLRPRPVSFFQEGARFFFRMAVLALMALFIYHLIFHYLLEPLLGWLREVNRDVLDERVDFFSHLLVYLAVWMLVGLVSLIFDYSKIITVHHNMTMAFLAPVKAAWFIVKHPGRTVGLYLSLSLFWLVAVGIYWLVAPGVGQNTWSKIWLAFALGQVFIFFRIWLRALFFAAQGSLYAGLVPAPAVSSQPAPTETGEVAA